MNLFAIDSDAIIAARQLCGKHIVKMPSESKQMISMAFNPLNAKGKPVAYYNHPASLWVRDTKENMEWAIMHGLAQCEEYARRYKRRHNAHDFIEWAAANLTKLAFPNSGHTSFARCFGEFADLLNAETPDTVEAYRRFYWLDKHEFARWPSIYMIPDWWPDKSEKFVDPSFIRGIYSKR